MLRIMYELETENDTTTPITIANALIVNEMGFTPYEEISWDRDQIHIKKLNNLEEIAKHLLVYVESQRKSI